MFKALLIASVFFASTIIDLTPREAEACGVKIGVGSAKGKRRTRARSQNPSLILVVGHKDQALIKKLEAARHHVRYASSVDKAPNSKFKLVIADASQMDAAKDRFSKAKIVKRKDRGTAQLVEMVLARRSVQSKGRTRATGASRVRTPVLTGSERVATSDRTRTATGTEAPATPVATPNPRVAAATTPAVAPTRATERVAANTSNRVTPKPEPRATTKPKPEPRIAPTPRVEPKVAKAPKGPKSAKWSRQFQFGTNKTNLNASAQRRLRANALWLEQNPSASVTIEGHTDSVGDEAYNLDLSERRANVARDFLLGIGVDESRINVVPKGETEPAVEPSTSARNRRIVLIKN